MSAHAALSRREDALCSRCERRTGRLARRGIPLRRWRDTARCLGCASWAADPTAWPSKGQTVKAVVQDRYGEVDVLSVRDIEEPVPGDDEVLIRVRAAGVDPGIWHLMTGRPYLVRLMGFGLRVPKVRIRGRDVAGTVHTVGKGVTEVKPGDDVYGTVEGSFAVQVAKGIGASVTGVCSPPTAQLVHGIGAEAVRHYPGGHFTDGTRRW